MIKLLVALLTILVDGVLSSNTIKYTNVIKNAIILNKNMPCVYLDKEFECKCKDFYSLEHVFPRCYLNKKDENDMHNIVKTFNKLNNMRSNYKYTDEIKNEKNWESLCCNNFVNHKEKLFIPNKSSRGFISRSILYMMNEYNYNYTKIIDKETLIKWFYDYPPTKSEIYHNEMVKNIQNKNNIFISKYNRKSKLLKFLGI